MSLILICLNFIYYQLNINISSTHATPDDIIDINYHTKNGSVVSLLAFDKALTFLHKGNDIDVDDVINVLTNRSKINRIIQDEEIVYDEGNKNYVINLNFDGWRECTSSENDLLNKFNLPDFPGHSKHGGVYFGNKESEPQEMEIAEDKQNLNSDGIRKNFPETWIWETSESKDGTGSITETIQHSMTTWLITGFSMNTQYGFALSEPQELIVSQEFFVELNLPYSIRFGEILELEVIIFNFLRPELASDISANLTIFSIDEEAESEDDKVQFEFLIFPNRELHCRSIKNPSLTINANVSVPHRSGFRYVTYVRPLKNKNMKIRVEASVTINQKTFFDKILKDVVVENEGVAFYSVENKDFNFNSYKKESISLPFSSNETIQSAIEFTAVITGDKMGPSIDFNHFVL